MSALENIRRKIQEGIPVIGVHGRTVDSGLFEMMARAGNDFVWIENEHAAIDRQTLHNHILAVQGGGAAAFVRVAWNDPVLVKPILEIGPDGIVFPMIRTAEEARLAVASCTYPPAGIRGFGPMRANQYGMMPLQEYLKTADANIWKVMQIEHVDAVGNLEGIVAVPGVDALVVGMMDLSGSVGRLGQLEDPTVVALMNRIGEIARRSGIPLGVSMGYHPERIRYWIRQGISWISTGADVEFVARGAMDTLAACRAMFAERGNGR